MIQEKNMAPEEDAEDMDDMDQTEHPPAWESLQGLFSTGSRYTDAKKEDLRYERRLWDSRFESFLDSNLPDYLHEFGVVDEVSLHVREERVDDLESRRHELLGFVSTLDTELTSQEGRVAAIEKIASRRKST